MSGVARVEELVLAKVTEEDEARVVSLVDGASLAVLERSRGPVTQVAYGVRAHGHKILCAKRACARVLGVTVDDVIECLTSFFSATGPASSVPFLSDLMDAFDQRTEHYSYLSWDASGDIALRREEQGGGWRCLVGKPGYSPGR